MVQTLFVYYKLPQAEHAAWRARVQVFADRVKSELPHVEVALMQRPLSNADGQETWMEIYRSKHGLDDASLAQIAALAELYPWPSKRAAEVFVELKS
jgi:hypothetical protein